MVRITLATVAVAACVAAFVPAAHAQQWRIVDDDDWCESGWRGPKYCEVREVTLPADRRVIEVDGGQNGSIRVEGWSKDEIRLRVKITIWKGSSRSARERAEDIEIKTGDVIVADGPSRGDGWSASYDIMVPRESNLWLETVNGGIAIVEVEGDIEFDARNGGIHLAHVAGDVRGKTTNGGVEIDFHGDGWHGDGLDVRTTNGGVEMHFPDDYSADLVTGTVNGRIHLDFPVEMVGTIGSTIKTKLGDGGPRVKVLTTNGGVHIRRI